MATGMKSLVAFIRENRQLILDEWLAEAMRLPSAHPLSIELIRDHIPEFLDRLTEAIERQDVTTVSLKGLPNLHAALRVREGYDLRQVVGEYRTLRAVILHLYRQRGDISEESRPKLLPLATMHAAIDLAIADAVDQYALDQGKAREMFIGMLSHDLRDPLNAILFSAQVLLGRASELDAATLQTAGRISAGAKRMEAMIRDLLDFARGRLGVRFPISVAPIDARALIADTVTEIAVAHPERAIECRVAHAPGDFVVQWDGDRVAQAITNLVSNAIAHGADPIVVEPNRRDEWISIEVRNRGEIPAPVRPHLFAPFAQPDHDRRYHAIEDAPQRRRGHLGLGLYIVREIATAHGGAVRATSEAGHTTFTLTLPRDARASDGTS